MAETNNLKEVYQNVFESSKKIITKNQRNLYINTLDLITRTTNTICAKFLTDDVIKFLYTDILELVFDEDINIQNNAITAMETILNKIDISSFQNSVEWIPIRQNIIQNYSEKLHLMRDKNNSNWYKIWCLIMRIINQEITRSASTINVFLYVVELGFRSIDHQVRAESFKSWKVLVEIFSKHDLTSLKRIKLISIPLRSSQAKTELTALHKFKVWWLFVIKLQENGRLLETSEQTFEPFLSFCFGSKTMTSQLKPYFNVKEMAVISLIEMLNSTIEIKYQMEKLELEKSSGTVITQELFNKHFEIIIRSVCEASTIILEEFLTNQKTTIELLWKNLIEFVINYDSIECFKECFDCILLLMKTNKPETKQSLNQIVCSFATNKKFLSADNEYRVLNVENVARRIIYFSNLLFTSPDKYFSIDKTLISSVYRIECFSKLSKYWELIKLLLEYILEKFRVIDQIEMTNNIDIKLSVWVKISQCLISYINENSFEFRIAAKALILNEWIFLPIEIGSSHLNNDIIKCWKEITIAASKSEGRAVFITVISSKIVKLYLEAEKTAYFDEIIITVIECSDTRFDQHTYPKQIFVLLLKVFSNNTLPAKILNNILEKFACYLKQLERNELSLSLSDLIGIVKCLQKVEKSKPGKKVIIGNFKKVIQDVIMKRCSINEIKQYNQALKSNDDFVIIPAVWTLNPDRLTEHQKEKMRERKNSLPALYNDMSSHSQDSYSLKSWTPNKIVISKNKDNEEIVVPGLNEVILVESPRQGKNLKNQNTILEKPGKNCAVSANIFPDEEMNQGAKNLGATSKSDEMLVSCCKTNKDLAMEKSSVNGQSKSNDTKPGESNATDSSIKKRKYNMKRRQTLDEKPVKCVTTRSSTRLNASISAVPKKVEKTRLSFDEDINNIIARPTRATRSSGKQSNDSASQNTKKRSKNKNSDKEQNAKNKTINSDDEIIQPSQSPSESVISRRKSLGNSIVAAAKSAKSAKFLKNSEFVEQLDNLVINTELSEQSKQIAEADTEVNSDSSVIMVIPSDSEKVIEICSNNLFEADTEINTEELVSETNESISAKSTPPRQQIESEPFIDKRKSPRKQLNFEEVFCETVKSGKNNEEISRNSILCSPDHQTLEQTREFICNTSNISPISDIISDDRIEVQNHENGSQIVFEKNDNLIIDITNDVDKQLSPTKRKMTGPISLSSPSDRKKTVNTLSPTPKPKTSTLTGRGAQLINMIRNRNANGQLLKDGEISVKRVLETSIVNNMSSPKGPEPSKSGSVTNIITSTPQSSSEKDLLTFSKVLPSPYASPTASILKRKANRISLDETEVQASKRKRVGFSDPVSITKEYALQPEEDRIPANNSARGSLNKVLYPTTKSPSSTDQTQKHLLKRKSRVDSMVEIAKYNESILSSPVQLGKETKNLPTCSTMRQSELSENSPSLQRISPVVLNDTNEMESFKLVETSNNANQLYNCDEEILGATSSPKKSVTEDALDYILNKYTLDDLLLKYIEKSKKTSQDLLTMKTVKALMKEIMHSMASDQKIQTQVFETLSEKHPKEYLDHAIQENLCSVVCDRLDFSSVLSYIFEKSKINNQCQKLVVENIYQMLKSDKHINDKYELIQNLLRSKLQLSNEEILNCIELLMQQKNNYMSNCDTL